MNKNKLTTTPTGSEQIPQKRQSVINTIQSIVTRETRYDDNLTTAAGKTGEYVWVGCDVAFGGSWVDEADQGTDTQRHMRP